MKKGYFEYLIYEPLAQQRAARVSNHYWIEMIQDMVDGLGYSYSRIAKRIGVSPSTIQKLVKYTNRKPRHDVLQKLLSLHYKLFYSEFRSQQAEHYLKMQLKQDF